ncbi:hypothetical protein EWM64_g4569 [Hericium alpestre]|uniref:DRBM domain-containing protein n=1 Tax=Hericium alpestre TaxID=135208 RepID=A0A4Y9ZZG1_9AGAM|nr:hypothetical protein EWM64_g4569 [Hericium alpestre]
MAIRLTGDSVLDLNNVLQSQRQEHLLSWQFGESGLQHQLTHYATVIYMGQPIARGAGLSRGDAKQQAAAQVLRLWGVI